MVFIWYLALRITESSPKLYCKLIIIGKHYENSLHLLKYQWQWLNGESFTPEVAVKFPSSEVVFFFVPCMEKAVCNSMCFTKCIVTLFLGEQIEAS